MFDIVGVGGGGGGGGGIILMQELKNYPKIQQ